MEHRVCFIIPYFGVLPDYLKLFLKSCEHNLNYDFMFFTNQNIRIQIPKNVTIYKMYIDEFEELIKINSGIKPNINFGWKICDFKPAYGLIFKDYITKYKFWGILDIDIVLGNISNFISEEDLNSFDVISALRFWLSGSFAIFRNTDKVNNLFKLSQDWQNVFTHSRHFAFDECGRLTDQKGEKVYNLLSSGVPIFDLKTDIESFTHILKNENKTKELRILFRDMNCEKLRKDMFLEFNYGNLFLNQNNVRSIILYYHFVNDKNNLTFRIPFWKNIPDIYFITKYSFLSNTTKINSIFWQITSYFFGISKMLFIKTPKKVLRKLLTNKT